ncbi:MAG: DNA primase [Omnitrophica bacterium]|nr:DNA primase [Candidatus Omnitrophota bacterium]
MIPQAFIEEVQSRTDIVEVISSYIPAKRTGRNFKALCPFHGEKTPSFIISPQKQIFHCFGCGEGGGVFQFLALMEKVNFPEAVEMLARRLGLDVPYKNEKAYKAKTVLYEAVNEAASFFHKKLKNDKEYQPIRNYLNKRGIADKTIDKFKLGYAPGNNSLINHMRKVGFTLEVLERASLVTAGRGGFRDLFHGRISFPIFDVRSRIIGFGGRIYKEMKDYPKYINSLENALYSKRDNLFGLNFSKEDIIKEGKAIVVEGYLDMIIPFMRGIKNIVASLGTALTLEQIRLIKRYTSGIILIYDSDKAGQRATLRSLDLLLENNLRVDVVSLPQGYDPDSLIIKNGKDCFLQLLDRRCDFFEYKLNILKGAHDVDTIGGKSKIAQEMLTTIDKLNSEIEKYEYIKRLANNLGIKEEIVIAEFQSGFSKNKTTRMKTKVWHTQSNKDTENFVANEPLSITEKTLLKVILTNPKAFSLTKKNLKEEYFRSYLARRTISFLFNSLGEVKNNYIQKILREIKDKEISSFISKILMDDGIPSDKNSFKDSLLKLRKIGTLQLKKKLQGQIKQAEDDGDQKKLKELIRKYSKINNGIRNG